jgi:hypothetical protein
MVALRFCIGLSQWPLHVLDTDKTGLFLVRVQALHLVMAERLLTWAESQDELSSFTHKYRTEKRRSLTQTNHSRVSPL